MPLQNGHWPQPYCPLTQPPGQGSGPKLTVSARECAECSLRKTPTRRAVPVIVFPLPFFSRIQNRGCGPSGATPHGGPEQAAGAAGARSCRCLEPVPEGVEVVAKGAGAMGTKCGIVVGAAVGMTAYGPVAATRDMAAVSLWVSGHGRQLHRSSLSADRNDGRSGCSCARAATEVATTNKAPR